MLNRILNRNPRYNEWLLPYLEGGLDEAHQAQLEARLAADPALAAEAERLRRTLGGLRGMSTRTPRLENAQVPANLWPHLRARLVLEQAPAPRPRARAWWLAGVGAPAAAALIVAAFWLPNWHTPSQSEFSHRPVVVPKLTPASPMPSSGQAQPGSGVSTPTISPPAKKSLKAVLLKPLPAPPVVVGASPFDLPVPITPMGKSAGSVVRPPSVPNTPGFRDSRVAGPPVAPAPIAPIKHSDAAEAKRPAASALVAGTPAPLLSSPAAPMPLPQPLPGPKTATATAGTEGGVRPVLGAIPKETGNGLDGSAQIQPKSQSKASSQTPPAMLGQISRAPHATRRKTSQQFFAPGASGDGVQAFGADPQASLDSWQAALSAAVQTPLWGENMGEMQANQALMSARESGMLEELRTRLEARRAASPRDLVMARMLAAVYDFGFSTEPGLREHRRIVGLEGAGGEDWYALAHAEEHVGNGTAARNAYRRALESPIPPSPPHAAIARGRS